MDEERARIDPALTDGLYAGAARGHADAEGAKVIGLPRPYGYGASMGAWVLDYVAAWAGEYGVRHPQQRPVPLPRLRGRRHVPRRQGQPHGPRPGRVDAGDGGGDDVEPERIWCSRRAPSSGSSVRARQAEHVLGRRRRGSGWSRSARPGRAASRGTCARCRTPRRSRSRRASAGRRSPPPTTPRPRAASPCSPRRRTARRDRTARAALIAHQVGRLDVDVRARDRKLHALVLADRPAEHDALVRVARRALDEPAAVADALGGDQDPLGVQAVEDVAEALALLADQRRRPGPRGRRRTARSSRGSSSSRIGRIVEPVPTRLAQVDEEDRQAVGPLLDLARAASCARAAASGPSAARARSRPSGR